MSKLRKMFGHVDAPECIALMRLIETQSTETLAAWAIRFSGDRYLKFYETAYPGDLRLHNALTACRAYLAGEKKLSEIRPVLKEAQEAARDAVQSPAAQAAARAISTACSTVRTPTNALGFVFYGAAAAAYGELGLEESAETYSHLATVEFERAIDSLRQAAVQNEPHPAKISWNC